MISVLTAGFFIGLAGSIHCVGMCGPIAAALPSAGERGAAYLFGRMLYHLGRSASYVLLGAAAGLAGQRFVVAGFQQEVSVAVGSLMVLTALLPGIMNRVWANVPIAYRVQAALKKAFGSAFRKRTRASLFAVGVVNGFLPCGLVYMAMAGASATGSIGEGMLLMAGFGIGTMPLLFGVSAAGSIVPLPVRRRLLRLAPVFVFVLGIILILRGLNLGIPMVSPKIPVQAAAAQAPPCCMPH